MSTCNVCEKVVQPAYAITYLECPCTSHADCVGEDIDVTKCANCLSGKKPSTAVAVISTISEPHTEDGIDYVKNPGKKGKSLIGKAVSLVSSIRRTPAPAALTP